MKSKKVTMLVAALVVAVVAFAAVGYATTYTAKTTNTSNELSSTYITLSQTGTAMYGGDFLTSVYFDTVNTTSANAYEYTPVVNWARDNTGLFTDVGVGGTGAAYALISNPLTIAVDKENVASSEESGVRLNVGVSNFTPVNGLTYTMILTASNSMLALYSATIVGSSATTTDQTFTFNNVSIAGDDVGYNVYLFISLTSGAVTDGTNIATAGFNIPVAVGEATTTDSVFTFLAIVNPPQP